MILFMSQLYCKLTYLKLTLINQAIELQLSMCTWLYQQQPKLVNAFCSDSAGFIKQVWLSCLYFTNEVVE